MQKIGVFYFVFIALMLFSDVVSQHEQYNDDLPLHLFKPVEGSTEKPKTFVDPSRLMNNPNRQARQNNAVPSPSNPPSGSYSVTKNVNYNEENLTTGVNITDPADYNDVDEKFEENEKKINEFRGKQQQSNSHQTVHSTQQAQRPSLPTNTFNNGGQNRVPSIDWKQIIQNRSPQIHQVTNFGNNNRNPSLNNAQIQFQRHLANLTPQQRSLVEKHFSHHFKNTAEPLEISSASLISSANSLPSFQPNFQHHSIITSGNSLPNFQHHSILPSANSFPNFQPQSGFQKFEFSQHFDSANGPHSQGFVQQFDSNIGQPLIYFF